ncbi:hypothetical protein vseg_017184 [Gypsophila vaccaria]
MEENNKLKHVCKFCKKKFGCGRSLGGHIRCHLPKKYKLRENPKKTWRVESSLSSEEADIATVTETETEKFIRLMGSHDNSHSSNLSEVVEEQQQQQNEEDVALCLIMLSRDVGPWGHNNNNNKRKRRVKKVQSNEEEDVFTVVNGENLGKREVKLKGVEDLGNGLVKKDKSFNLSEKFDENVGKRVKMEVKSQEMGNVEEGEENVVKNEGKNCEKSYCGKRSKFEFECTTCNKMFHSYQALGGHKASHKKNLGANDCGITQNSSKEDVVSDISLGTCSKVSNKVVRKHECPFCFRVFGTGQALGGHKRSHMLGSSNSNEVKVVLSEGVKEVNNDDVIERSSSSETRDTFHLNLDLDLNLPPKHVQEEGNNAATATTIAASSSSNSLVGLIKPYWWVENPHKSEPFLSLIHN